MSYKKIVFGCIILFLFLNYSDTYSVNWETLDSKPFIIYHSSNDESNAQLVLKTLVEYYKRLSNEFGYKVNSPIGIFLCNSVQSYREIVGKNIPGWSIGLAIPRNNRIILRTDIEKYNLQKTAVHELTHIMLRGVVNKKSIPIWLNEGLAVYYSDEQERASGSLVSKALLTDSIIPFEDLEKVLTFEKNKAQLAYQESYLAVLFLIEEFGIESLKKLLHTLAIEEDTDSAFKNALGLDLWDFELKWYDYIKRKQRWNFLVDFDTYLWFFILILFIIGVIFIRIRNRKKIKTWDKEENTTDLWLE